MNKPSHPSLSIVFAATMSAACGQLAEDASAPSAPVSSPTLSAEGDTCVEEIREPNKNYIIARILRRYDNAARIVREDLVDLHPDHKLRASCYSLPTGYSRRSHEWKYDQGGRVILDHLVDQGDGEGCSGTDVSSEFERTAAFDSAGLPLYERDRHLRGDYETTQDTVYTHLDGKISTTAVSTRESPGQPGTKQTTTWSYNAQGQAIRKELRYSNGKEEIQSRTRWEYDPSGAKISETSEQDGPVRTPNIFARVEKRIFDKAGNVVEEWIDSSTRVPHSNAAGPYVADGNFDSKGEFTYDARGLKLSEKQIILANGALNAKVQIEKYWTYDAQGRVTSERSGGGQRLESTYGPHGISVVSLFDVASSEIARATFLYDAHGRHTRTIRMNRGVEEAEDFGAPWSQYEYDANGWISRSLIDTNHDGQWDEDRRFSYACRVEFTSKLGREPARPY